MKLTIENREELQEFMKREIIDFDTGTFGAVVPREYRTGPNKEETYREFYNKGEYPLRFEYNLETGHVEDIV